MMGILMGISMGIWWAFLMMDSMIVSLLSRSLALIAFALLEFVPSSLQDKNALWSHINVTYESVWSRLRFPTQPAPTRFPQLGISYVPRLFGKKKIGGCLIGCLHDLRKWVFCNGPQRQINRQTLQLYEWNGPGADSVKTKLKLNG